jgi:predicted ester cyclase
MNNERTIKSMSIESNQSNKQLVWEFWQKLESAGADEISKVAASFMTPDMPWHGPDPINELRGAKEFADNFWLPLKHSFSNPRRDSHMFFGGPSNGRADGQGDGRMWVGGTGWFSGVFAHDWLSIPATGEEVQIRWGELCCVEDGRISEIFILLDIVDLLQQAGHDVLPKARGKDGIYPPPLDDDAVYLEAQDEVESERTLKLIRTFIFDALNVYDQEALESMGIADYFPADVQWYGPGGIGACDGLQEFENLHQKHWLHAFPDRAVQDLDNLIAEGAYTGGAGWNGVRATHSGQYLDCPATDRKIGVTGLDFWRREGDKFTENWVFVDMVHLFRQFGVDLFERIR